MKPDSLLQEDVIAALKANPQVVAASIGVVVRQGVVELSGDVRTHDEKLAVERVVQAVPGVKALAVELTVTIPGHDTGSDLEIARFVELGLTSNNGVRPHALKVVVESGVVTLTGDVDSAYEKQAALDSPRYLRGVMGVVDEILVKPTVAQSAVRSDIEAALHRLATTEAAQISISLDRDEVTLTGTVRNWDEGQAVIKSVEQTRGVRHVVDKLSIVD